MAEEIKKVIIIDTKKSQRSIKDLKAQIEALKKELDGKTLNTGEFEASLDALASAQKEYAEINAEIASKSKPMEKQMFDLARFGESLAKSYSAASAAMGLLAGDNEDLNKALLRTAQTIQLIQGLEGIPVMFQEFPRLIDKFKDWLKILDPISNRINKIADKLSGLGKIKADINIKDKTGKKTPGSAVVSGGGGGYRRDDKDIIEKESKAILPLNKALEKRREEEARLNKELAKRQQLIKQRLEQTKVLDVEINKAYKKELASLRALRLEKAKMVKEANATGKLNIHRLIAIDTEMKAIRQRMVGLGKATVTAVKVGGTALGDAKIALHKTQEAIKANDAAIAQLSATLKKAKIASTLKSIFSTVGWTLLITAILSAVGALFKFIGSLKTAKGEIKAINKDIAMGTAQLASENIVKLKELAIAYRKLGDSAQEKSKFIKEYAKEIEETGFAASNVNEADKLFINETDKYIEALMARAKAQATENKAIEIYQEYLEKVGKLKLKKKYTNPQEFFEQGLLTEEQKLNIQKPILDDIEELTKEVNKKLNWMFEDIARVEKEYGGMFVSAAAKTAEDVGEVVEDLDAEIEAEFYDRLVEETELLKQYYKDAENLFKSNKQRELDDINAKYKEQIELAKKYGQDTSLLEQARLKEINDINEKYGDEALSKLKDKANKEYDELQSIIERIRKMYDTSYLREPSEVNYRTKYHQDFAKVFGLSGDFIYQSREDLEDQYSDQVWYNDQLYEMTASRINQENELLQKQLNIKELDADRRMEIERTLRENEIALSDAALKNEEANTSAYIHLQEAKNIALNKSLEVASSIMGSMSSIVGETTKAGKAFAVAQATIDTYKSANEAYSAMAGIPIVGPALGIAAAAAAVLAGIANVKRILSVSVSASGSMSGSISGSSVAPPPNIAVPPINYTRSLIGDKETDQLNNPIKCYVVADEISAVQNKVKVVEDNATF